MAVWFLWGRGLNQWFYWGWFLAGGCGFSPAPLERGSPERGALQVFSYAVGTAGNLGLPSRGPISWEEMGEKPQREEVLPSGLPSLVGLCGGKLYFSLVTWPAALTLKGP